MFALNSKASSRARRGPALCRSSDKFRQPNNFCLKHNEGLPLLRGILFSAHFRALDIGEDLIIVELLLLWPA